MKRLFVVIGFLTALSIFTCGKIEDQPLEVDLEYSPSVIIPPEYVTVKITVTNPNTDPVTIDSVIVKDSCIAGPEAGMSYSDELTTFVRTVEGRNKKTVIYESADSITYYPYDEEEKLKIWVFVYSEVGKSQDETVITIKPSEE